MTNPTNPGAGRAISLGEALAYGLAGGVNNFVQTNNVFEQQRQQQANVLADQQFRQAQADEQRRQADRLFNFQVDSVAFDRVNKQRDELVTNLKAGAFDKDPLLKQRATHLLTQAGKISSMIGKGQRPDETLATEYDQLWTDFGELAAAAGINLGVNAKARDDLTTNLLANQVKMSDFDVEYTEKILPKKIEGFIATQDTAILQQGILAAIAPYQTATGKAEALAKIAGLGGTSAGVVQGLVTDGLIDPDTAKQLQDRMSQVDTQQQAATDTAVAGAEMAGAQVGEFKVTSPYRVEQARVGAEYAAPMAAAGLRTAEAAAGLSEAELAKVKATADSTIKLINDKNDYESAFTAVQKGLLKPMSAAMQAKYLSDIAATGGIGAQVVQQMVDSGDLDPDVAAAVTVKADRVEQTEQTQLEVLVDQAAMTANERQFSDATLNSRTELFNSNAELSIKSNLAELDLLKLKTPAQRGAYLQGLAKMGDGGMAIIQNLVKQGVISQTTADAFSKTASNAQKVDDSTASAAEDQAALTDLERQKVQQTLTTTIQAINSTNDLTVKVNNAKKGLIDLESGAQRASFLAQIAATGPGGAAIIDGLAKQGVITPAEASGAKTTADLAGRRDTSATLGAEVGVEQAKFNLDSAKQLFPIELGRAQTALETAQQALNEARAGQPYRIGILKEQLATLKQTLSQNAQMFGPQLAQAKLQVQQLESEIRVLEATEPDRIKAAQGQANSAWVAGQVDLATLPDQIAARQVSVQQAQAALQAQLTENRFADATFAAKVERIKLDNSTAMQQLLALKQQYKQNAVKFPRELAYLNAQIAVQQEAARSAAAERMNADGTALGDPKLLTQALTRMSINNGQQLRAAQSTLKALQQQYLPNARFNVDKWDSKQYNVLTQDIAKLPPEVQAQFRAAASEVDALKGTFNDLQKALAGAPSGRVDPAVAERLGLFLPNQQSANGGTSNLTQKATTPGTDLTKLGIRSDAVYSGKDAKGNPISYCSKFARQYTAQLLGKEAYSPEWSRFFGGDANETLNNFRRAGALIAPTVSAKGGNPMQYVSRLKEGDLIFLNYGNPAIDHVAVYDGKGGIIQHSLPSFQGQKIQGSVNTMSVEEYFAKAGNAQVSFAHIPSAGQQQAASSPAPKPTAQAKLTDVTATVQAQAPKLTTFYAAVRNAPNAAVAQKLLHDKAIQLAGGPNAPQSLKAQYFDALYANVKSAPATSAAPLTKQAAQPLILKAGNPAELEAIQARLEAAGMPRQAAVDYIRGVMGGRVQGNGGALPSQPGISIGGQTVADTFKAPINNAIRTLGSVPADKRPAQAQIAAQSLAKQLQQAGYKGITAQQVLQFLGSTGGKPL